MNIRPLSISRTFLNDLTIFDLTIFFTKFTFSKNRYLQNSHLQNINFVFISEQHDFYNEADFENEENEESGKDSPEIVDCFSSDEDKEKGELKNPNEVLGEPGFNCQICSNQFETANDLKDHYLFVHLNVNYDCKSLVYFLSFLFILLGFCKQFVYFF